jgi:predicted  nucleic acid-binding Zn-ribbon protein
MRKDEEGFLIDSIARKIKVFNRDCVVCGETFKAKSKIHKKCDRCGHMKVNDAEERQQVAYQEGRFGVRELDELYEPEDAFEEDERDTGYSEQEIFQMFSEDDDNEFDEDEI